MSNALTIFDDPRFKPPAHIANTFGEESNIEDRVTVPSLSYEGKVWSISLNGEKTRLMKRDSDGDEVPLGTMRVIILDFAKRRGRAYYEGAYDPAKPGSPICWSDDGLAPHAKVPEDQKQCNNCEKCPMSVKGSKVTEQNKAVTACSQHRMLVVAPASDPLLTPLRLKIAITSDWDKNEEMQAQGWFAFNNYTDFLRSKNVKHSAALVTKMKFDPSVAYPKLLFSPDRWLEEAEALKARDVSQSEDVKALLGGTWSPAGVDGTKYDAKPSPNKEPEAEVAEEPEVKTERARPAKAAAASEDMINQAAAKAAANKAAKVKPAPADDDDDEIVVQTKPAPKAAVVMEDDDDEIVIQTKPAAKTKAADDVIDVPSDLADIAAEWGDD